MKLRNFRHSLRIATLAAIGVPLFAFIHCLAHWIRFEDGITQGEDYFAAIALGVAVTTKTFAFLLFRIYQSWNRYVSLHDLVKLAQATTLSCLVAAAVDYLFLPGYNVPRSIFLMDWGITILIVGALRSAGRLIREHVSFGQDSSEKTRVFIVGANDAGETLLRSIRRNANLHYQIAGFIAEHEDCAKGAISGAPVVGDLADIFYLAKQYQVSEVLITSGELSGQHVRELVEIFRDSDVSIRVLPSYEQLLHGHVALRPREVSIEDLLRRDPVQLDIAGLHEWIDGQVLLVTGSAGSIGSEICRQLLQFSPKKLILVDQSETGQFFLERQLREINPEISLEVCIADIADTFRMSQVFCEYGPDIVFHAAAYKHVPLMEANPSEAVKNITAASRLMADLAEQHDVSSFVMISTDKAVNPTSVMGACKRVAEMYVQSLATQSRCRFVTVRFGNVLDSAGSVIPIFRDQIAKGGPVTVTHPEMTRYFMTIPEASQLVIQAGAMGNGGEIFVLDMGDPVRIANLAEDMIRLSGLRIGEDIEVKFVGVRPGEKLFEELHIDGEMHLPTSHPKIMVAASAVGNLRHTRNRVDTLHKAALQDTSEIIKLLSEIVPEFRRDKTLAASARSAA